MRYGTYALAFLVLAAGLWVFFKIFSQSSAAGWLTLTGVVAVVAGLLTRARDIGRNSDGKQLAPGLHAARMVTRKEDNNLHRNRA